MASPYAVALVRRRSVTSCRRLPVSRVVVATSPPPFSTQIDNHSSMSSSRIAWRTGWSPGYDPNRGLPRLCIRPSAFVM
eukprot:912915-Rhodomonas_salina.1